MRVTILAVGSRGDVQPAIGLGLGLRAAGFKVCIAAFGEFEMLIESYGFDYKLLRGDVRKLVESEAAQQMLNSGNLYDLMQFVKNGGYQELVGFAQQDSWEAAQGSDVLIYHEAALWGYDIAEQLNIPAFRIGYQPVTPTRAFPAPSVGWANLTAPINYLTHIAIGQFVWHSFRKQLNQFRRETLHLTNLALRGSYAIQDAEPIPVLYGFSPSIIPKPNDWGEHIHVTGYWFAPAAAEWHPPSALLDFLDAGPPPVYVGFGSMGNPEAEATTKIVVDGICKTGQRGVLAAGWGGLKQTDLPDNIFLIKSAPHTWLFPKMSVVVHHGGAGTSAAGLLAGVPTVVVPHFADQFFWGHQIHKLGIGPNIIPRKHLTPERLARDIKTCLNTPSMKTSAHQVAQRIRAEKGVDNAVHILQNYLQER